ncbi:MAG: DUF1490 family protein [Sporichthyaceae bacterium]
MAAGLFAGSMVGRLVQYAVAGTLGNVIVRSAGRARPYVAPAARRAAVRGIAAGIVGGRRLGDVTEEARLAAGDMIAEARATLGETAPAPGEGAGTAAEPTVMPHTSSAAPPPTTTTATLPKRSAAKKAPARKAAPRKSVNTADHGHEH